jgi:GH24 family phage-related lysozyme (muramidase)
MTMDLGFHGAKLLAEFEFPGGIQTKPERDALGIPTIMGMTHYPDGRAVDMKDRFTEAEVLKLYGTKRSEYVDAVNESLRIPVNQNQFDGLVCMCYNAGIGAFQNEPNNTVLRMTNAGRFEDAAAAFGMWVYGTLYGGGAGPDGGPARGPGGEILPKGKKWMKAFRGLYRRYVSSALLYCGLNWERAASLDKIHLTKRTEERPFGFFDVPTYKTPWKLIREDARYDLLPLVLDTPLPAKETKVASAISLVIPDAYERSTDENAKTAWLNVAMQAAMKGEPAPPFVEGVKTAPLQVVPAKVTITKKVIDTPNIKAEAPPKAMESSQTFKGLSKANSGQETAIIGGTATVLTASLPMAKELTGFMKAVDTTVMLKAGLVFGGVLVVIGLWRWWRGLIIAYEGRQNAEGPKV